MPVSFVCLFRGETIDTAQLLATSTNAELVRQVACRLINDQDGSNDPVRRALEDGRLHALTLIAEEGGDQP